MARPFHALPLGQLFRDSRCGDYWVKTDTSDALCVQLSPDGAFLQGESDTFHRDELVTELTL